MINRQHRELLLSSLDVIHAAFRRPGSSNAAAISHSAANKMETVPSSGKNADSPTVEFARCFLRLANLPNFALDRLSRYEATLWRQAGQIMYALEKLDRRKPQERARRVLAWNGGVRIRRNYNTAVDLRLLFTSKNEDIVQMKDGKCC